MVAEENDSLHLFLHGTSWSCEYARRSLPVLVRWITHEISNHRQPPKEYCYQDLATAVGQPKHAHPIHEALGVLGFALKELEARNPTALGKVPPIQLLVWSKGKGSPGDDAFGFVGISKEKLKDIPSEARRSIARDIRATILKYPHWHKVLGLLSLKPLIVDLPDLNSVASSPDPGGWGGGESEEHKALKHFLGTHYRQLGLEGNLYPFFEEKLASGDVIDLMLKETSGARRACIEVKSRISNDCDLIRGVFQCVKYQAVLAAESVYESAKTTHPSHADTNVILAIGRQVSKEIQELGDLLGVQIMVIKQA